MDRRFFSILITCGLALVGLLTPAVAHATAATSAASAAAAAAATATAATSAAATSAAATSAAGTAATSATATAATAASAGTASATATAATSAAGTAATSAATAATSAAGTAAGTASATATEAAAHAEGLSVYAVISAPAAMPGLPVETDRPFKIASAEQGMQYLTTEAVAIGNGGTSAYALGKTTSAAEAGVFFFESVGDGTYRAYTFADDGTVRYLSFKPASGYGQSAQLYLSSTADGESVLNVVSASDGSLVICWAETRRVLWYTSTTYHYLYKHNLYAGECFFASSTADEQARRLTLVDASAADPLALDGTECVLMGGDAQAVGTQGGDAQAVGTQAVGTDATTVDGTAGLAGHAVTADGEACYVSNAPAATWTFVAQGDGTYALRTEVAGALRYLSVAPAAGTGDQGCAVTLSDEPCHLTVDTSDGKVVLYGESNKVRVYCGEGGFAARRVDTAPAADELLTLAERMSGVVAYDYAPGAAAGDDGTHDELPQRSYDTWGEGYTVASPQVVRYDSLGSSYVFEYAFDHWYDAADPSRTFRAGDAINESPAGTLTLRAAWSCVRRERTSADGPRRTVVYDLNLPTPAGRGRALAGVPTVPGASGRTGGHASDSVGGAWAQAYAVLSPSRLEVTTSDYEEAYAFCGWAAEDGRTVQPRDVVNLTDAAGGLDPDGDGTVTLHGVWSSRYNGTNRSREVHFYLSIRALSTDVFNPNPSISTQSADFTEEVYATLMTPAEYGLAGRGTVYLVNYQQGATSTANAATDDIVVADEAVRSLGADGLVADGTTYRTLSFPTDEEIFANIQSYIKPGSPITLDGVRVDAADLTTENFTIRWYVCKYQGTNDPSDYWHIDGKLTPRVSLVTVTKTFAGDEAAIAQVPNDFRIVLANKDDPTNTLTLTLDDRTTNTGSYGLVDGGMRRGTYGYIRREGNRYTWLVPAAKGARFGIREENYDVATEGASFGIAAQYSIVNPAEDGQEAPLQQWFGTAVGYAATYPTTDVDFTSLQTTNLFNTYVETGTFVVQLRDAGTGYVAMPNVGLRVYEVVDGGRRRLALSRRDGAADGDGRYSVLYENGAVSDVALTGADGNAYLTLPHPAATGAGEALTYLIEEDVPEGYLTRLDGRAPSFMVRVDGQGRFELLSDVVLPEGGSVSRTSATTPGGEAADAVTTGAVMTNQPHRLSASVEKSWELEEGDARPAVVVALSGKVADEVVLRRTLTLSDAEGWQRCAGDALPVVCGNEVVSYEIEETRIGDFERGSAGFASYTVRYLAPTYRDANGAELARDGAHVAAAAARAVRDVTFRILNEGTPSERVELAVVTRGSERAGGELLAGAQYQVFEVVPGGAGASGTSATYRGSEVVVRDLGVVDTAAGATVTLRGGHDYLISEVHAPDGYAPLDEAVRVHVDGAGLLALPDEGTAEGAEGAEARAEVAQGEADRTHATLLVCNQPAEELVSIRLVDDEGEPVDGQAAFALAGTPRLTALGTVDEELASGRDGVLREAAGLPHGTYELRETRVPAGYDDLGGMLSLTVASGSVSADGTRASVTREGDAWVVSVVLRRSVPAPTGVETRRSWWLACGAGLVLAAVSGWERRGRKVAGKAGEACGRRDGGTSSANEAPHGNEAFCDGKAFLGDSSSPLGS